MKDWQTKLLLCLVGLIGAGAGWYLREVSLLQRQLQDDVTEMRVELARVSAATTIALGGDPFAPEED